MLHESLRVYLESVEQAIERFEQGLVERYVEEILTHSRVNLRIRIRSRTGHLLEVHEAIIVGADTLRHMDYRYHCQDDTQQLVFRYDSTPHFPGLPDFPQHKHQADKSVIGARRLSISAVLDELALQPGPGKGWG